MFFGPSSDSSNQDPDTQVKMVSSMSCFVLYLYCNYFFGYLSHFWLIREISLCN